MLQPQVKTLLNGVTADTTSAWVAVDNAQRISIQFLATGISGGNGVFTVEVSNNAGTTATAYNRLTTNVTNTNVQTDARVASVTLSSNTSSIVFIPPGDTFAFFRVSCDVTTDGVYSAFAYVN